MQKQNENKIMIRNDDENKGCNVILLMSENAEGVEKKPGKNKQDILHY